MQTCCSFKDIYSQRRIPKAPTKDEEKLRNSNSNTYQLQFYDTFLKEKGPRKLKAVLIPRICRFAKLSTYQNDENVT